MYLQSNGSQTTRTTTTDLHNITNSNVGRARKIALVLVDMIENEFPLINDPEASIVELMNKIRAKFKQLQSLIGGVSNTSQNELSF